MGSDIWKAVNPDETNPRQMLATLKEYVSCADYPRFYLLIDEYDNFTNTILSSYGQKRYRKKTHGEGLFVGSSTISKILLPMPVPPCSVCLLQVSAHYDGRCDKRFQYWNEHQHVSLVQQHYWIQRG